MTSNPASTDGTSASTSTAAASAPASNPSVASTASTSSTAAAASTDGTSASTSTAAASAPASNPSVASTASTSSTAAAASTSSTGASASASTLSVASTASASSTTAAASTSSTGASASASTLSVASTASASSTTAAASISSADELDSASISNIAPTASSSSTADAASTTSTDASASASASTLSVTPTASTSSADAFDSASISNIAFTASISSTVDAASTSSTDALAFTSNTVVSDPPALLPAPLVMFRIDLPPEIASIIASYLGQTDIASCCSVSRHWHWIWSCELWTRINISTDLRCLRFNRRESQRVFRKVIPHLLSFSTLDGLAHGQLLQVGPVENRPRRLERLELAFPALQGPQASQLAIVLGNILRCDRLTCLSLSGIRRLRPTMNEDPRSMCLLFWVSSDVLQSLFVDLDSTGWVDISENWPFQPRDALPVLHSLGHFSVSGVAAEGTVAQFLQRCPNLVTLEIHREQPWPQVPALLCHAIHNRLPKLEAICHDVPAVNDEILTGFLESIRWHSVTLSPSGIIGDRTRLALINAAPTLQKLIVDGVRGFFSTFLQELFMKAEKLRVLSGLSLSLPLVYQLDLRIQADHIDGSPEEIVLEEGETEEEMGGKSSNAHRDGSGGSSNAPGPIMDLPRPWTCLHLETLAINVSNFPRRDVGGRFVFASEDQPGDVHRKVYRQLGRLTRLRELSLGHGPESRRSRVERMSHVNEAFLVANEQPGQFDCLSMSLPAGLGQLGGLKEMRILDVSGVAHKIGVAELNWMREHWPLLKTIVGLEQRVGIPLPHTWNGRDVHDVRSWMRRHPNGIGSAYPSLP